MVMWEIIQSIDVGWQESNNLYRNRCSIDTVWLGGDIYIFFCCNQLINQQQWCFYKKVNQKFLIYKQIRPKAINKQTFHNHLIISKHSQQYSKAQQQHIPYTHTLTTQQMAQFLCSTMKKNSFQKLKQAKQEFSKQINLRSKKMKKKKYLKEEIYKNHNIFHSLSNINHFSRTMTAQNIIWVKNYQLKQGINKVKEENSSLKARIWNVQKQNRKMDRQIQAWGLRKAFVNTSSKPYIDSATAEKVLHDQDYSITSIKIMIVQLTHDLEMLQHTLDESLSVNKNIKNIKNDMKYQLNGKKVEMYKLSLGEEVGGKGNVGELEGLKEEKKSVLMRKNQELGLINRNIEMKKKSKGVLEEEMTKINSQMVGLADITKQKITLLKQQADKIRNQDQSYVNEQVKKLTSAKEKYQQFECKTQDKMGEFIKEKIELGKQITKWQKKIQKIKEQHQRPKQEVLENKQKSIQLDVK